MRVEDFDEAMIVINVNKSYNEISKRKSSGMGGLFSGGSISMMDFQIGTFNNMNKNFMMMSTKDLKFNKGPLVCG